MSVCTQGTNRLKINEFLTNIIFRFFENLSRKLKFNYNPTRITGTLHEDVFTFICPFILLRMRNILDKSCREKQDTRFTFYNFFPKTCRLWENVAKCGGDRDHKWRHNIAHTYCMLDKQGYMDARACTLPRADTHTHAYASMQARARTDRKCVTFTASTRQQWFADAPQCT